MSRDCHRRLAGRSRSKRWPDVAAHPRRVGPRLVYCANAWLDRLRLIERESQRSNNLLDYRWPRATLESVLLDGLWLTQPHNYIHQLHRPPLAVRQAIELIQVPPSSLVHDHPGRTFRLTSRRPAGLHSPRPCLPSR
jgi:hypothetical protein